MTPKPRDTTESVDDYVRSLDLAVLEEKIESGQPDVADAAIREFNRRRRDVMDKLMASMSRGTIDEIGERIHGTSWLEEKRKLVEEVVTQVNLDGSKESIAAEAEPIIMAAFKKWKLEGTGDQHPEAFCLMRYACKECKRVEVLWNTRNGVTPFILSCKYCGGESSHAPPWSDDKRAPDHVPVYGDRVFVDLTRERHELLARKSFEKMWKRGTIQKAPGFKDIKDKDEALAAFLEAELDPDPYGIGDNQHNKGQPDIRTIGRDMVWLKHIPRGSGLDGFADLLLPQLCEETRGQDLEKIGVAIAAGAGDLAELEDLSGRPDAHEVERLAEQKSLDALRVALKERSRRDPSAPDAVVLGAFRMSAADVPVVSMPAGHAMSNSPEARKAIAEAFDKADIPEGLALAAKALKHIPNEDLRVLGDRPPTHGASEAAGSFFPDLYLRTQKAEAEVVRLRAELAAFVTAPGQTFPAQAGVLEVERADSVAVVDEALVVAVPGEGPVPDLSQERLADPTTCDHSFTRTDANMVRLLDGSRVLEVTARCQACRHRWVFCGYTIATNASGTIVSLPVELGSLDTIKTCERCHKDHDDPSGLICSACAAEARAENATRRRVTCRACGHSASYRASEQDPTKCKRCRSKQIDIMECEITEEEKEESFRHLDAAVHILAGGDLDCLAEFPEDLDDSGLAEAVEELEQEGGDA